jgi:threonine synthase
VLGAGGEGIGLGTPLWPDPRDAGLLWKREDLNRTGSFKDRGASVLAALAVQCGARKLVLDSSGSAALAGASAAASAGLPITVHTPETLPANKREALRAFGARILAEGNRESAGARAREAAQREFYLSHIYHPAFFEGTALGAMEVLRQTRGSPPRCWVIPVGNGSLLLGTAKTLERAQRTDVKLIAVQSASCPGLKRPGSGGRARASGIGIADPPRREEVLAALDRFGGEVIEVEEEAIVEARDELGRRGVIAELASAAVLAGVQRLRASGERGEILGWLTGSGYRGD